MKTGDKIQYPVGSLLKRRDMWVADGNEECPVCLDKEPINGMVKTKCGHKYHIYCINKVDRCPLCRGEL